MTKNVSKDFVLEIGVEELPPNDLEKLINSFSGSIIKQLQELELKFESTKSFVTPRRLAIFIKNLDTVQNDRTIDRKGPAINRAFDKDNNPTPAGLGFAKSCNVEIKDLKVKAFGKSECLYFLQKIAGKTTIELLPEIIAKAIKNLPISKKMRWSDFDTEFVRPVHWILSMLDDKVVSLDFFSIKSSGHTFGHRFMSKGKIKINKASDYEKTLENNFVIPCFEKRKNLIIESLDKECSTIGGDKVIKAEWLTKEVTGLVEHPVVLAGNFNKKLLKLPSEVLISSMEDHQRCFPIMDKNGNLLPNFLLISNLQSKKPEIIIKGNERVIDARLKDALFYFEEDQKSTLEEYATRLKSIIFQKKLGSLHDKVLRISTIANHIASILDANVKNVELAAKLCKADLLTQMVYEFTELQGTTGYYYAKNEGIDSDVAIAIRDHYLPNSQTSNLPENISGICISIADKIDSLVGMFGINKKPTGEKDPFALRRQALGIIRMLIEKNIDIDIKNLLNISAKSYGKLISNNNVIEELIEFFLDRSKNWFASKGINPSVFVAASHSKSLNFLELSEKIKAIVEFEKLTESISLSAANKRVKNILDKNEKELNLNTTINEKLFTEIAEKELFSNLEKIEKDNRSLLKNKKYTEILSNLSRLEKPLESFFANVMVMCEEKNTRLNRLVLLKKVRNNFLSVGDISALSK